MSYLRYLCLFVHSGVQHILCCVFCFVCLRLCCQFHWFVYFWLPLRCSLTFMYNYFNHEATVYLTICFEGSLSTLPLWYLTMKIYSIYVSECNNIFLMLWLDFNSPIRPRLYANHFCFDFISLLLTPDIRLHGTGVGIKNADVDKKSTNRVGICKRSSRIIIFSNEIISYNNCIK